MNDLTESYKTLKWHLFWAFSIATVTFFLLMDRSINVYDEGVILTGAMRVLNGEMIHRDFYANYGPANFYLLAWMFKLFGSTIFVERMLDLIIRAAIVVSVFHIISQSCNSRYATIGSLLVGLWLASVGNYGYPVYPALLLALLSVQMLIHFTTNNQQDYHLFIAGIFTGLCAFFRYDIGFLVMVANIASITYIHTFLEKLPNHRAKNINTILFYIAGSAIPVFGILFWYAFAGALESFIHDVIRYPSLHYAEQRSLPFPGLMELLNVRGLINFAIYLPVMFITLLPWYLKGESLPVPRTHFAIVVFLGLLSCVMYIKGFVRVSVEHMQISLLPSIAGITLMASQRHSYPKLMQGLIQVLAIAVILSSVAAGAKRIIFNPNLVIKDPVTFFQMVRTSTWTAVQADSSKTSDARRVSAFTVDAQRSSALKYIVTNTDPDDTLFVGLTRHDKIFVNDVSVYFITQRTPATQWHHFDPGLQTSQPVQETIVSELEVHKPHLIWLESTWNDASEPNASALSSGVIFLDNYINDHYKLVRQFGTINILQRSK